MHRNLLLDRIGAFLILCEGELYSKASSCQFRVGRLLMASESLLVDAEVL